ncbi:transcriptional regulator, TetR family [Fodinibius roseus]|uniref:Transcriptional regulator, TetR family n=1 Tax=Fodinibius roseus TaxID=1194090 RepID=A0A1M5GK89_9BACT|nr:TetR/AcrR family transcriptional regulator [Fodinibius roseus]SHG04170.1 transcriptional regulator, TetR family [Fodinibius roseus]
MGIEERKQREKEERYNVIVDAAEKVIFSKGIEQATMQEIAREAELSKGTLYLYFKSKNELYTAITLRGSDMLNRRFARALGDDHSGLELVRKLGRLYLDFVKEHPDYFKAFMHYESMSDVEELRESDIAGQCEENRREALSFIIRALQIGMQDGTIDERYDPRELAMVLWASTRGITTVTHMKGEGHYFRVLDEMEIDTGALFDSYLALLSSGIASGKHKKES